MRGFLLFDIDGVIRDVASSYRLAIQETVNHFCNFKPSFEKIDNLKSEGLWNNDWDTSLEIIKRYKSASPHFVEIPRREKLVEVFTNFYFGGDPNGNNQNWTGFIRNEKLLVNKSFFEKLTSNQFSWGFISGAEPPSARFVLETRLGLKNPPLIAMGEAPEKPDPSGLIKLSTQLAQKSLGSDIPTIAYLGDTVADVLTVKNAQKKIPSQKFLSFAVAPPHLHSKEHIDSRINYEKQLKVAGADRILKSTNEIFDIAMNW